MKKIKATAIVFLLFLMISSARLYAQETPPPVNPPVEDPEPESQPVPITGLEYLLISGGVLGGYKLIKKKLNKE